MSTSVPPPGYVEPSPPRQAPLPPPQQRTRRPILALGGVGLAVAAGLAYLLLGSSSGPLRDPVALAAMRSSSTAGYRMRMSIEMTSSALGSPFTVTGSGVVDLRAAATSMSLAMNLGNDPQVIQALGSNTMRFQMILDRGAVYMKLPAALLGALPISGKSWVMVDLGNLGRLPGLSSLESNPTMSDPGQILEYMRSVSGGVVSEGQQQVDGFETTHYHADLSLAQLANALPAGDRALAQKGLSELEQAVPSGELPIDVWIDRQDLVRRVAMSLDFDLPSGQSMDEGMTIDLSDYGPQSQPTPPPSDQVADLSNLASGAGL